VSAVATCSVLLLFFAFCQRLYVIASEKPKTWRSYSKATEFGKEEEFVTVELHVAQMDRLYNNFML